MGSLLVYPYMAGFGFSLGLGISLVFLWLLLNFSQLYTPLSDTTILPRQFINEYVLPGIVIGFGLSTIFTVIYCSTILCCCEEELLYPLTIH